MTDYPMKVAEILLGGPGVGWRQLRQLGVDHAVAVLPRRPRDWRDEPYETPWELAPLTLMQATIEHEGFRVAAIEDNPPMDRIRLGRPGREEEIEAFCTLLRNMGALGIEVLCYNWSAVIGWVRTEYLATGRGGAHVGGYDHARVGDVPVPGVDIGEPDLWANFRYFLDHVIPVAEEAGVRLALHPDDPPVSPVRGIPRVMSSVAGFERVLEMSDSPAHGITLCQGNFSLMTDDLPGLIRDFGGSDRIKFVHFRDVRGEATNFVETFHDEGPTDMFECMRAYVDAGYAGVLRTDHNPTLAGDDADVIGYSPLGRLHAVGYVQGLREAAYAEHARRG